MTRQSISIFQGDSAQIQETVSGLASLEGYSAVLVAMTRDEVEIELLNGTIDGLTVTYNIFNTASKDYPTGIHEFETKIFDESGHVYTSSKGKFIVEPALETEPESEPE